VLHHDIDGPGTGKQYPPTRSQFLTQPRAHVFKHETRSLSRIRLLPQRLIVLR
jgi:hypothetical protein